LLFEWWENKKHCKTSEIPVKSNIFSSFYPLFHQLKKDVLKKIDLVGIDFERYKISVLYFGFRRFAWYI